MDLAEDRDEQVDFVRRSGRDERRRHIIDVAREVFLLEGYAAASMAAIAARLGGSKGTLYNYFESKEDLFASIVAQEAELEGDAEPAAGISASGAEAEIAAWLSAYGRAFLRLVMSDRARALHRLVIAESARFPELGRAFYENGPARRIAHLAERLALETDAGRVRTDDPEMAAIQFLELCKAGLHRYLHWGVGAAPGPEDQAASVAAAVRIFLAAYGR